MKRTLRTKIWCGVLVVACVSGVAFGVANLPRVQAEAVSGGVEVTEAPGNEAVVSEESKAEVPEISGNPEISEVSETAEVSSAKEEFESHFTADENWISPRYRKSFVRKTGAFQLKTATAVLMQRMTRTFLHRAFTAVKM